MKLDLIEFILGIIKDGSYVINLDQYSSILILELIGALCMY